MGQHASYAHHLLLFEVFLTNLVDKLQGWVRNILVWPVQNPHQVVKTQLVDECLLELVAVNLSHNGNLIEI